MQINIKGFITSKKGELYSDCRDNYNFNTTNHKFAISDGVSKSFFPGIWSDLLTVNYVNDHHDFVIKSQDEWLTEVTKRVNKPNVKYYTRNAFNRKEPGLATFVGLQFSESEMTWSAQALGDSFLFFVPKDYKDFDEEFIKLSSKPEPIEFDNFPDYYSSIGNRHNGVSRPMEGKLTNGTFYLMTDALAEWFIFKKELAAKEISLWESQLDFERFIELERESGELGNDDSAILIVEITEVALSSINYDEINVSNLADLIEKQETEAQERLDLEQNLSTSLTEFDNAQQEESNIQPSSTNQKESLEVGAIYTFDGQKSQQSLLSKCYSYVASRSFNFRPNRGNIQSKPESILQELIDQPNTSELPAANTTKDTQQSDLDDSAPQANGNQQVNNISNKF